MKNLYLLLATAVILSLSGCETTPKVATTIDESFDLSTFATFSLMKWPGQIDAEDPRVGMLAKKANAAVAETLESKGYTQASPDSADFLVAVHGQILPKTEITDWGYRMHRYGRRGWVAGSVYEVEEYNQGTLIIDIVDAASRELVWRGWATKDHIPDNPDGSKIPGAVATILADFPNR